MSRVKYFVAVRPQTNDYHSLHKEGCPFIPENENRIYLGEFGSGMDALKDSQQIFKNTKCCIFCSKEIKVLNRNQPLFDIMKEDPVPEELRMPVSYHQCLLCCVN
jgi:hypothetical protein